MLNSVFYLIWVSSSTPPALWQIEAVRSPGPTESYQVSLATQLLENEFNEIQLDFGDHQTLFFRQSGLSRGNHILWVGDNGWGEQAILTYKNGWVSGLIYDRDQVWTLAPDASGQVLQRVDPTDFPPCAGAVPVDLAFMKIGPALIFRNW